MGGVKHFSVAICDDAQSTARSSSFWYFCVRILSLVGQLYSRNEAMENEMLSIVANTLPTAGYRTFNPFHAKSGYILF